MKVFTYKNIQTMWDLSSVKIVNVIEQGANKHVLVLDHPIPSLRVFYNRKLAKILGKDKNYSVVPLTTTAFRLLKKELGDVLIWSAVSIAEKGGEFEDIQVNGKLLKEIMSIEELETQVDNRNAGY